MKRRFLAVMGFAILLLGALGVAQNILKAKFINDSTTIVNGFYAEEKNDIDVLFLGSSNCFCTINPLVLYKEYGIAAYNFASSSQPMDISLLYLKEALKCQKPKVVALEVNYISGYYASGIEENSLRWGLTDIPLSVDKLKCIYQLHGKIDGEYLSYVFPILRYHERWKEISKQDYVYMGEDKSYWSKGYLYTEETTSEPVDLSGYRSEGSAWLDERAIECLDEMIVLCKENGAELVLFKAPRTEWYQYMTEEIESLASQRNIPFVDYNLLVEELNLDMATDFRDVNHLNNRGAAKVTSHFGAFLKEHFNISDRRQDGQRNSWDEAIEYEDRYIGNALDFSAVTTVTECKEMMAREEGYATLITYNGGSDFVQYQWIYVDSNERYSKVWDEDGIEHERIEDMEFVIVRKAKLLQIYIENQNYHNPQKNWSVVIYDLKTGKVVTTLEYDE